MTELVSTYYHKKEIGFHFPIKVDDRIFISSHYPDDYLKAAIASNKSEMKKYSGFSQKTVSNILRKAGVDRKVKGRLRKIFNLKLLNAKPYEDRIVANVSSRKKGQITQVKIFNPYTQHALTQCTDDTNKNIQETIGFRDTHVMDYWNLDPDIKYDNRTNTCHHVCFLEMKEREKGNSLFDFYKAIPNEQIQENTSIFLQFLQELNQPVADYVTNYSFLANSDMFDDVARQIDWPYGDTEKIYYHDNAYMEFIRKQVATSFGGFRGEEHGHEKLDTIKECFT